MNDKPTSVSVFVTNPFTGLWETSYNRTFKDENEAMRYARKMEKMNCGQMRVIGGNDENCIYETEKYIVDWQYYWGD